MKKYLILTVTAGNGHNSAAKELRDKILEENPKDDVKIVDVFKEFGNSLKTWTMNDGYFLLSKYLVKGYNFFYRILKNQNPNKRNKSPSQENILPETPEILKLIYDYKPDIIYCTHFAPAIAITNLRKHYPIPAKVFAPVLDYGLSPFWECTTGIDYIISSCDVTAEDLLNKGFKQEQILNYGIAVGPKFSKYIDKNEAREILNLDKNRFTILIMKASFFTINNVDLLKELEAIKSPIQIVIINGKSKKEKAFFDRKIKHLKSNHKYINLGFINNVDIYYSAADLAICKGGGLTTTECLNKCLPNIIVNNLPQQEIYNKDYVLSRGCSIKLSNHKNLHTIVNLLACNPKKLEYIRESILKVRQPGALNEMFNFMNTCPNAVYEDINVSSLDNKEVVSKIRKTLNLDHKLEMKNK